MPYIDQGSRKRVLEKGVYVTAGDLAFHVSHIIEEYRQQKGDRYQTFADVGEALRGAAREFERKVVNPYEDKKLVKNGTVHAPHSQADVPPELPAPACATGNCA